MSSASQNSSTRTTPAIQTPTSSQDIPIPSIETSESPPLLSAATSPRPAAPLFDLSGFSADNPFVRGSVQLFTTGEPVSGSLSPAQTTNSQRARAHPRGRFALRGKSQEPPTSVLAIADDISGLKIAESNSPVDSQRHSITTKPQQNTGMGQASNSSLDVPKESGRSLSEPPPTQSQRQAAATYDAAKESLPEDAFNDPQFQRHFSASKTLARELASVLSTSTTQVQSGSTVRRLQRKATELANFHLPGKQVAGFVGDSGVGKSSLINSLLHKKNLVPASNGGFACTCTVTEFHYHDDDSFSINVDFFDEEELLDELKHLLQSYRRFHLSSASHQDEDQDLKEKAALASDTFCSMFRDRLPSETFLRSSSQTQILNKFRSLIATCRPDAGNASYSGLAEEGCVSLLKRLCSQQPSSGELAAWPYIRKIRVSLKANILSKGLILVDLPGLRDSNRTRRNITERFLVGSCDAIFVVCSIARATSDQSVQDVLNLAKTRDLSNVKINIICTKSDDNVDPDDAQLSTGESRARLQNLRYNVQLSTDTCDQLDCDDQILNDADPPPSQEISQRSWRHVQRARKQLADDQFRLDSFLIQTRNDFITSQLRQKYIDVSAANNPMEIFCVGNTMYKSYRDKRFNEAKRHIKLSGITELRRYCISMVSDTQYQAAKLFIQNNMPALLSDVELWLQAGSDTEGIERRQAAMNSMAEIEERLELTLLGPESPVYHLSDVLRSQFLAEIYQDDVSAWSIAAQEAERRWSTYSANTYIAFCAKYGFHRRENWNGEVIQMMVNDITEPWQALKTAMTIEKEKIVASTQLLSVDAIQSLEQNLKNDPKVFSALRQIIQAQQNLLEEHIQDCLQQAEGTRHLLGTDCMTTTESSWIALALRPAFDEAKQENGKGVKLQQVEIMSRALANPSLFSNMMSDLRRGFIDLAQALQDDIMAAINVYLEEIEQSFNLIRDENAIKESQQDAGFNARVQQRLVHARSEIQKIQDGLINC